MLVRRTNASDSGRFSTPGFFFGTIAAVAMLTMATITGSAASGPGSEAPDTTQEVTMEQDDAPDAQSVEDESGGVTDDSASPASEQFIPGITDVLDAELGLWWLDDEPGEQSEESSGLAEERVIPGVTDVIDAEEWFWRLDTEVTSEYPARPDRVGPYQ